MTQPTPPGWHSDPAGTPRQRWWDGTTWTEFYADASGNPLYGAATSSTPAAPDDGDSAATPVEPAQSAGPPPPAHRTLSRGNKIALGASAAAVVVLVIIAAVAGSSSDDEDKTTNAASTTATATTAGGIPQVASTTAAPAPATTTAKPTGCQDAPPEYLDVIDASFLNGYQFSDVSAVSVGETWYIAGEITEDGRVRSRDDVFVAQDMIISPVTSTARTESTLPDLRRVLGVNVVDAPVQQAMDCARTY